MDPVCADRTDTAEHDETATSTSVPLSAFNFSLAVG